MEFSEFCSKLIERTDMIQLVGRYCTLKKQGKQYFACCPFHGERTPSMSVNPDQKLFYCFGCHKGGNAITFLQDIENIDRIDAIKMLAEEAHMEMPSFEGKVKSTVDKEKQARLYNLLRDAAIKYNENLKSDKAAKALEYIEKRKIPSNIVTRFGLGYSIDGDDMIKHLKSMGYSYEDMVEAGIAGKKEDKDYVRYYDVYYGRLMFPIINAFGQVVAFGGRVLEKTEMAKYRNSSNNICFDKSRNLYAINLLKKRKREGPIPYVIMCEGYMDVISLHKAGFDTAVASMGTALTPQQARMLKNYSENVIISYDGDGAGQKATLRGLDILQECGLNVKVAALPEGLDPDEVINNYGVEGYEKCLKNAPGLTEFKLRNIKKKYDLSDPEGRSKYTEEAIETIKKLGDPIKIETYLKILSRETAYEMALLRSRAGLKFDENKKEDDIPVPVSAGSINSIDNLDELSMDTKTVLTAVLQGKSYVDMDMVTKYVTGEFAEKIIKLVNENRAKGMTDNFANVYDSLPAELLPKLIALNEFMEKEERDFGSYSGSLRNIIKAKFRRDIELISEKAKNETNEAERRKLWVLIGTLKIKENEELAKVKED